MLTVLWGAAAAGAENHPDFFPKRQINDSWRTAELPEKADPEKLSLFQLANEAVEPDRVSKRNNLIPLRPGLKILHRREPGSFSTPIRLERGVKYTFSAPASCTNPGGNRIVISASFMDKNSKVLPSGTAGLSAPFPGQRPADLKRFAEAGGTVIADCGPGGKTENSLGPCRLIHFFHIFRQLACIFSKKGVYLIIKSIIQELLTLRCQASFECRIKL